MIIIYVNLSGGKSGDLKYWHTWNNIFLHNSIVPTLATLFHATGLKTARANELYFYKKNISTLFLVFFYFEDESGFFFVSLIICYKIRHNSHLLYIIQSALKLKNSTINIVCILYMARVIARLPQRLKLKLFEIFPSLRRPGPCLWDYSVWKKPAALFWILAHYVLSVYMCK